MVDRPQQHLNWDAQALWRRLSPLLPELSVEVLASADSTNSRLLQRARLHSGDRDGAVTRPGEIDPMVADAAAPTRYGRRVADVSPCLLVAENQTRGRGRFGRDWVASAGASLTFSLSLPLAPATWSGLSLAVGLALAEAIDPDGSAPPACAIDPDGSPPPARAIDPRGEPPRVGIKWPNDLWLSSAPGVGRKLGGVLIETVTVGERRMCVVGVGLNILPQPTPPELTHGYACWQEIDPTITAPAALAAVAEPLVRGLLHFQSRGFAPLVDRYAQRDLLRGQAVTTSQPTVPHGVAEGVDEHGALRVRSGALHHVVSGEVSVRLQPPAATA